MGKTRKISVTVDSETYDALRELAPTEAISFLIDDSLRQKLVRLRLRKLLDEMEREKPMTEEGRARGDALWKLTESFWTAEPSPPSHEATKPSAASSKKRSTQKKK
jgi:hypothetical protein